MATIDKHAAGSFCWVELHTSDQDAAKRFYESLFGWQANDMPMGPDDLYTIWRLEGRDAAAGCTLRPEEKNHHVPPHWELYIAVDNVDDTVAKAKQLGANILVAPFDVFDAGRMAVVQDPTGAVFCPWQAKRNTGIGIHSVHGTLCWADLSTPDVKRASDFYAALFGWHIAADPKDKSGYLHIKNGEHFIGGVPPSEHRLKGTPPHWMAYFLVDDVDATAEKAKQGGAKFYVPPMTMEGVGRLAILADPQGAGFAIFKSAR
jgi:uncharacterized protein